MTMKNFRPVDMPSGSASPAPAAPAPAPAEVVVEPVVVDTDPAVVGADIVDSFVSEGGAVTDADAPSV